MLKKLRLSILFLAVDTFSKAVAWIFLSRIDSIDISDDLSLSFTINQVGFGTAIHSLGMSNDSTLLLLSCVAAVYSVIVLLVSRHLKRKWIRVSLYFSSFVLLGLLSSALVEVLPSISLGPTLIGVISKLGPMILAFTVIYLARDKVYLILWSLVLGAGLGNTLGLIVPPFGTIDFVYSKFLNGTLGTGIFNLADLMIDLFYLGVFCYSVFAVLASVVKRLKRSTPRGDGP